MWSKSFVIPINKLLGFLIVVAAAPAICQPADKPPKDEDLAQLLLECVSSRQPDPQSGAEDGLG